MTFSKTIVADTMTPVLAYAALRAAAPNGASFLLESVASGERWGRFSILGYRPRYELILDRKGWSVVPGSGAREDDPLPTLPKFDLKAPLASIAAILRPQSMARSVDLRTSATARRFATAHVGYLAWDIVHAIDRVPPGSLETWDEHYVPLARFLGNSVVVVFDSLTQTVTISASTEEDVERAIADLSRPPLLSKIDPPDRTRLPSDVTTDVEDDDFQKRVRKAQEYIAAGDAFQIVLARTFSVPRSERDAFDVYRAMRLLNPSTYMYFLDLPSSDGSSSRLRIAGASPETMVRLEQGKMTVRPLAGTRPRGESEEEDLRLERELLGDEKERAEHVMLIDLGRNDVGRVARVGSVKVVRHMDIERYSHVMHIVSEVHGEVSAEVAPLDVVHSAFPAGTLSGAPKVRAMQIIRELEERPRGIYGGAVGYISDSGDLDFAIAIRTMIEKGDTFEVTAGAGIVDASDPRAEANETRAKARAVLCAIEAVSKPKK